MKLSHLFVSLSVMLLFLNLDMPADVFLTKTGEASFNSEAPLETIEAATNRVGAVLNVTKRTIAFSVPIAGFEGFNSSLQHEHFNENYMETDDYPKATFNGKIIEDVDLKNPGKHKVRAKGMLSIHGVEKERIVSGTVSVGSNDITIQSTFEVALADHDITIPKIVTQKIAEVVQVDVMAKLKPNN